MDDDTVSVFTGAALGATPPPAGVLGSAFSFSTGLLGEPLPTLTSTPLPAGLTLDATTGVISGTPTTTGTTTVTISASNVVGDASRTFTFTIAVPDANGGTDPSTPGLAESGGSDRAALTNAVLAALLIASGVTLTRWARARRRALSHR